MAYVRCDKDCNRKAVQPRNINVIDTFNNSNDFFHVDYEKKDKDNNVIPHRDPNVPQNTTYPTNPDVLFFDTNWTRRLSDNSAGVKRQYVQGLYFPVGGTYPPGHPDVGSGTYTVKPTDKYSSTQLLEPVYLATEGDDDLRIVDEANNDIFVVSFTEPIVVDDEGGITGQLLINEEGTYEVTNELGNPVEL
jgi:hypothetical protein